MRIGYAYNLQAYPPRGGNHVHALEIAQGFVDLGHDVFVLDDPMMPRVVSYSSQAPQDLKTFISVIDLLYVRIDARSLFEWPALERCIALLGGKPIVWEINAPSSEALAYSWLGGRSLNRPEGPLRKLKRWLHAIQKLPLIHREERYRRHLARKVDAAICVSSGMANYAQNELGIEKVVVLPNGGPLMTEAQIKSRRLKREDDRFTVLYSGSAMYPWQGLDILTETIRLAEGCAPDLRFVLAVNQRNDDLPSSGQVDVLEHLNRDEILDAICAADVCVSLHPEYTWSPYGFYNSPMKLFEYMACMVPVLTSNHGQMRELFSDKKDAYLCNNNPGEILKKIVEIRDDRVGANAVAIAGWERIQSEFNWNQNAMKTVDLFSGLFANVSKG